jgi:hypothetical protein
MRGKIFPTIFFGLLDSEDKGTTIFRNVGDYLPVDTAKYPRNLNHHLQNVRTTCQVHPAR